MVHSLLVHASHLENVKRAEKSNSCIHVDFEEKKPEFVHGSSILVCDENGAYGIEGDIVTLESGVPEVEKEIEKTGCKVQAVHEHKGKERHVHLFCLSDMPTAKKVLDVAESF